MESILKKPKPVSHAELGMWVGLASFAMLFATLFLSYGLARVRAPVWPPIGVDPLPQLWPTVSTVILLVSSYFAQEALRAYRLGLQKVFLNFWKLTLLSGFAFVFTQWMTWQQVDREGTWLGSNLFSNIFYTMTGLHALHILGGMFGLIYVMVKAKTKGFFHQDLSKPVSEAPQLAVMYWHFMDVIWVLMYLLLVWI